MQKIFNQLKTPIRADGSFFRYGSRFDVRENVRKSVDKRKPEKRKEQAEADGYLRLDLIALLL